MVSTNNTCRSFIAESLLRQLLLDAHQKNIEVISRGLVVLFPEPVHVKAADMVMEDDDYERCFEQIARLVKKIWEERLGGNEMIGIGSDHGGYALKQAVIKHLEDKGYAVKDYGCYSEESCDYPVYAKAVANAVKDGKVEKGILICGTGIGISITANKIKGIRAALCSDTFSAHATREHNDANILAMGARVVGEGLALDIVDTFLETEFSNDERHIRRINQIED